MAGVSGQMTVDFVEVIAEDPARLPAQAAVEYQFRDLPAIVFTSQVAGWFARADALGNGCGVPPLSQSATRPVLGTNVTLAITNIASASVAGVDFVGGVQVPGIDLGFLGMPACRLFANPQYVSLPFATGSSSAQLLLSIPAGPELIGAAVAVQALTVTPGANARGLLTSNGVRLVLGDN